MLIVASCVGGLPSVARDEESALFFSPGTESINGNCYHNAKDITFIMCINPLAPFMFHRYPGYFRSAWHKILTIIGIDKVTKIKIHNRKDIKKLGSEYGGWFVPVRLLDNTSICYCAGCGEDISFDFELINKFNCTVFSYDPTPRAVKYVIDNTTHIKNYHFYDIGLWDQDTNIKFYVPKNTEHVSLSALNLQNTNDYIELKVRRINGIMRDNGHKSIDLLKIDIEGAEYKVIDSIIQDKLEIKMILVEFDELYNCIDNNYIYRIKNTVRSLLQNNYRLIYVDGANYTFLKHI